MQKVLDKYLHEYCDGNNLILWLLLEVVTTNLINQLNVKRSYVAIIYAMFYMTNREIEKIKNYKMSEESISKNQH